jgi:hypothetical protein|nr:MAG TPA: hypothetical protein [Caudoviricetes sp.]
MVNVSQDIIKSFNEGNKQTALIEVTAGGKTFTITDADIIQGGLKIDRYCVTNSKIEVGSAVASELSLKLRNYDGKFNDVSFEGAVLNVKIGIKLASVLEGATLGKGILGRMILGSASSDQDVAYVPCGLFIVDTPPRKLSTISISALDYMVLFDHEVNASALSFPIHVDALIQKICSICNVTLATDVSVLPNHYFSIGGLPDTNQKLTYRQLLQWCAQLTGTCAFMDGSGRLVLKWYEQTGVTITASERYSSDMLENDITITGFTCDDGKGNTYLSGTADYTLDLSDCGFLTNAYEGVLKELQAARGGFAYRPYSATIKSAPYLFPLDMIRYKDKDGVVHDTIVTNVTLALNCNTAISGAGETVTSSSYAQSTSGVTSQQAATDRANLEKINQTATQTNQTKNDLTQFKTQYSSDFEKTQAAIESRVTKETYQTDMDGVSTRIGAAETKISQNADAITLRATKEELYSMITFTPENGLVITRSNWEGKVQITGQNVQVVRGNNKVIINDNGIDITDGYGSVSIYSGGISFHGIRNSKIFEWPYEKDSYGNPIGEFTAQTTKIDLSSYSSVLLVYDTHKDGTWFSNGGSAGRLTVILPVNGQTYSYAYPWNTVHWREVTVSYNGITFGNGNERTSDYKNNVITGVIHLEVPISDGVKKNDKVCRPLELYGFM